MLEMRETITRMAAYIYFLISCSSPIVVVEICVFTSEIVEEGYSSQLSNLFIGFQSMCNNLLDWRLQGITRVILIHSINVGVVPNKIFIYLFWPKIPHPLWTIMIKKHNSHVTWLFIYTFLMFPFIEKSV